MVERYRNVVGDANAPQARMSNPVDFASTGVQVAKAVGDVGDTVEYIGKLQAHRRNERAKLDANNASNAYQKALTQYLYDPDTGAYTQRKLGNADNVTSDFSDFADKSIEEISSGLTPEAADIFRRMAGDITMPMWKQTSVYEAKEMGQYRDDSYKATLAESINTAALDPGNEELFQVQLDKAMIAIGELNKGASETVLKQEFQKIASDMEVARIERVASSNPLAAQDMIENSRYLTEESRTKLYAKNKGDVIKSEARSYAQQAIEQFGGEYDQGAGLKWIYENVQDPDVADAAASEYAKKFRMNDMLISDQERAVSAQQEKNFEQLSMTYAQGGSVSDEEIERLEASGDISTRQAAQAYKWNGAAANSGATTKKLSQRIPNWNQLSELEQDRLAMEDNNVTPAMRGAALQSLGDALTNGSLTAADVTEAQNRNLITRNEERQYKAALKGLDKQNTAQLTGIKNYLDKTINPSAKNSPVYGMYPAEMYENRKTELNAYIADLAANKDPDIVKKATDRAQQIMNDVVQQVYRMHGVSETDTQGWIWKEPTAYAEGVKRIKENLDDLRKTQTRSTPKIKHDDVALTGRMPGESGAISGDYRQLSASLFGRDIPVTSGYHAARDGGKRQHASVDFGAPKGTPIRVPDLGLSDMTVSTSVGNKTGTKAGAGNYVKIQGRNEFGDSVEMGFLHMNDVGVPAGASIKVGSSIGTVGNSGTSRSANGGDGSHLHFEIKVNGKRMDPAQYGQMMAKKRGTAQGPAVASASPSKPRPKADADTPESVAAESAAKNGTLPEFEEKPGGNVASQPNVTGGDIGLRPSSSQPKTAVELSRMSEAERAKYILDGGDVL